MVSCSGGGGSPCALGAECLPPSKRLTEKVCEASKPLNSKSRSLELVNIGRPFTPTPHPGRLTDGES